MSRDESASPPSPPSHHVVYPFRAMRRLKGLSPPPRLILTRDYQDMKQQEHHPAVKSQLELPYERYHHGWLFKLKLQLNSR
jgi:hypothetical protein